MKKQCIILNGDKGLYTTDEVVELLRKHSINFKLVTKNRSKQSHPSVLSVPILKNSSKNKNLSKED